MSVSLSAIHRQRIREAAKAAHRGVVVRFRINRGERNSLVWWDEAKPRTQHVILADYCSYEGMGKWLEVVEGEYQRQLREFAIN